MHSVHWRKFFRPVTSTQFAFIPILLPSSPVYIFVHLSKLLSGHSIFPLCVHICNSIIVIIIMRKFRIKHIFDSGILKTGVWQCFAHGHLFQVSAKHPLKHDDGSM